MNNFEMQFLVVVVAVVVDDDRNAGDERPPSPSKRPVISQASGTAAPNSPLPIERNWGRANETVGHFSVLLGVTCN